MISFLKKYFKLGTIFQNSARPYFLLIFISFAIYSQSLLFDFSYFDDDNLIVSKYEFLKNPSNLLEAFKYEVFMESQGSYYRPLLTVSFMIDAWIGGEKPFMYHLTNIILHSISICLFYILILKIINKRNYAFVISVLFAIHPVSVQAVAWVPGRNDTLLAIFIFTSFISFLKLMDYQEDITVVNLKFVVIHFLCFLSAMLTKETAIILPFLCFVYLIFYKIEIKPFKRFGMLLLSWIGSLLIWYLLRSSVEMSARPNIIFNSLNDNLTGFVTYVGKIFLPFNLSVLAIPEDMSLVYGFISIVLVLALLIVKGIENRKLLWFGLIWFVIFLAPTFVRVVSYANFLEHRLYVPLFGFALILIQSKILFLPELKHFRILVTWFFIVLFLIINFNYTKSFANLETLKENIKTTSPNSPLALNIQGVKLFTANSYKEAEKYFLKAIERDRTFAEPYNNLGLLKKQLGDFVESEKSFLKAIKIKPTYAEAYNNLGNLYQQKGLFDDAELAYVEAITFKSDYFEAHNNLGTNYARANKLDLAEKEFLEAVRINPNFAQAHYNLALLYLSKKDYYKAIEHTDKAIESGMKVNEKLLEILEALRR